MSLGDEERKWLRRAVEKSRERLIFDLTEVLEGVYGLHQDGRMDPLSSLPAVKDDRLARETRELLVGLLPPPPTTPPTKEEAEAFASRFDRVLGSLAFTHLNRLVAFKMMEHPARKIAKEAVGRQQQSRGFKFWLADRPELQAPGQEDESYRAFLLDRCRELHAEIGVLFDPDDLASRVFPGPRALGDVLALLNDEALADVWGHDEALGWTYQYYTPEHLREEAHEASPEGPRDGYELAFLNQFYTPHYVVQFLVDNTLGRLWLEMKPESRVRDACTALLVRPGEELPARAKRDPRTLRVLDPACGSGHFLLYAFDLLADHVYPEAWEDPELGPPLQNEFGTRERYIEEIPRLIVEENLHGIDIDRRATQIATLALFLKAKARSPRVTLTKSGIVCAEPLPRDPALVEAFKRAKLGAGRDTLQRVFDGLVDRLAVADEAGTLLRAERAIEDLVREEHEKLLARYKRGTVMKQQALLPEVEDPQHAFESFRDVVEGGLTVEDFFQQAEKDLARLLEEYATEAEGTEGARRRMLAKDSTGCLRFVDAVRRRYDVVLMNPPFGAPTVASKERIERWYPASKNDLSTMFVERGIELAPGGFVGVIATEAGLFRRTAEDWRRLVLERTRVEALVHLGGKVLDAKVRVASFVLRCAAGGEDRASLFLRILREAEREARLAAAIRGERAGEPSPDVYRARQSEFAGFPYAVFGYWCAQGIRSAFSAQPRLDKSASVPVGLQTSKDFRFLRLRWEVPPESVNRNGWAPFAKGGEYSPFHDDVHLCLKWGISGRAEIEAWGKSKPQNIDWFFLHPGLTYPPRAKRFAPRLMPVGCAFGHKGPAVFVADDAPDALHSLCGTLNSRPFIYLLSLGTGEPETLELSNMHEVGLVQRMPLPPAIPKDGALARASAEAAALCRKPDFRDETTAAFVLPFAVPVKATLAEMASQIVAERDADVARFAMLIKNIEDRVCAHYGFGPAERAEIEAQVGPLFILDAYDAPATLRELAARIVSWAVGVIVGRFDVRLATGARPEPGPGDPFAAISARSPGALPEDQSPSGYPIAIDSDGILVDDPGHEDDIVRRVVQVLTLVWGSRADAVEREICEALGVRELRNYFRKTGKGGFWDDTFHRYGKSHRRAPIYWLLRSSGGDYCVWLYYHRLSRETLFKVLGERYLRGRIERCRQAIGELRPGGKVREGLGKSDRKRLEEEEALLVELEKMQKTLEAVVRLTDDRGNIAGYDPDLSDGVVLNAAPLHEVIPWPEKRGDRSELAATWDELREEAYDWAQIAMRLFPDRVRRKCKKDASLAIAHGLDAELFPGLREKLAAARGGKNGKKRKKAS